MEEYKMNEELLVNSPIDASEFEHIGQDLGSLNEIVRPSTSFWKDAFGRIKRDKVAITLVCTLAVIAVLAIIVPMVSPYNMAEQHLQHTNQGMFFSDATCFHIFRNRQFRA